MLLPIMMACRVGALVADYLHPHSLFPALMQYTQDASAEVRQAAVYGVGVMA